ncbi:FAD-dependent oxidoreductase [Bordetella sp. BOR01]|uniref:FAD-dependent oxidoreductase n=1 Tax=Bordetella sp. BOR01 TaxID=2854779 RepID=UPI001C43A496|nr:NAD(P)/FAD-dependent oxidoreductase [Bordetella sp. BOR01]MBV7482129.1 NAD(P)/FAD-dependent oxidoreductase [Bordetella sp. BOR01]
MLIDSGIEENPAKFEQSSEMQQVNNWLRAFEQALQACDREALLSLFADECYWRDMLAFTWNITPHEDRKSIVDGLIKYQPKVNARNFSVAEGRTPPRQVRRTGNEVIEAIFSFETDVARCHGVLRLPVQSADRAWVFSSSTTELKGHEEPIFGRRPTGAAYSRNFGAGNWSDMRATEQAYEGREPTVLIIGGGQAGVTLGARLRLLGVDALIVEKTPQAGQVWANRYHSLALHNEVAINHFPYIPFPPNWPKYLPKDMLAGFIGFYAWAMECNVWGNTRFLNGDYDEEQGVWNATVRLNDGTERTLHPKHLVFANGIAGGKKIPALPGLSDFKGEVLHTEDYYSGGGYKGKRVLVLGTGTSGHDCAQDLHGHGARVKLIQRGSTTVVSVAAAGFNNAVHYQENIPIEDADLIGTAPTFRLLQRGYQLNVKRMKEHDKELLEGLRSRGFKVDFGPDEAGHQMKLRSRHGGYYLNCGCSELIVSGDIGLLQWENAQRFVAEGLLMNDGHVEKADLLIAATGYHSQEEVVRQLLGEEIARKTGPIWGVGQDGELQNMFGPTPQQGLWFLGGGLSQNRVYSHFVAIQIKARELGLVQ